MSSQEHSQAGMHAGPAANTIALLATSALCLSALIPGQCPGPDHQGDIDLWPIHGCSPLFRDYFVSHYNLQEKQWNEGWGWKRCDAELAFGKMMNACYLLTYGLADSPVIVPVWDVENLGTRVDPATSAKVSGTPVVVNGADFNQTTGELIQHVLAADDLGSVIHYYSNQADGWLAQDLSTLTGEHVNSRGTLAAITGAEPASTTGFSTHVFGRKGNDLVHFWIPMGGTWTAENLTASAVACPSLGISSEPVVINGPSKGSTLVELQHVFARSMSDTLAHYWWDHATGWCAEDLTVRTTQPGSPSLPFAATPAVINGPSRDASGVELQHVFGASNGCLIHYWWEKINGWRAENLTERVLGAGLRIGIEGQVAVINGPSRDSSGVLLQHVFGRLSSGELVHYVWGRSAGWFIENLTARVGSAGASAYRISGNPVVVNGPASSGNSEQQHVFALDDTGQLIHYWWGAQEGWAAQNLSELTQHTTQLTGDVSVLNGPGEAQHVVCRGVNGDVIAFSWLGGTTQLVGAMTGWTATNLSEDTGYGSNLLLAPGFVFRPGRAGSRHVFGRSVDGDLVHYFLNPGPTLQPWHDDFQYSDWAAGSKHDFRYEPSDRRNELARAFAGLFRTNHVDMKCPIFWRGPQATSNPPDHNPARRVSIMLHEATHIIYANPIDIWKHQSCPGPMGQKNCDDWFSHPLGQRLVEQNRHSMYQIEIEYLCDLGEFAEPWVPASIWMCAPSLATGLSCRIKQDQRPGWTCGSARPLN